jgi:nucleotide-binding universal stress UspA family protein
LILAHVFDWPSNRPTPAGLGPVTSAARREAEDDARRELRAAVSDEARRWCDCSEVTAIGKPHEEIVLLAAEHKADAIVMGVHGRNSLDLALFGSTTNQVVRHATCPVLTVRP